MVTSSRWSCTCPLSTKIPECLPRRRLYTHVTSSCSERRRVGASSVGGRSPAFSTSSLESKSQSQGPDIVLLHQESLTLTAEGD